MTFARISLILTAAVYAAFGAWLFVAPDALGFVGVGVDGAGARVEVRSFYGGLELGFALFFAVAATRPAWFRAGLFAQSASLGAAGAARAAGMLIEGAAIQIHFLLMGAELVGASVGIAALLHLARSQRPLRSAAR